VTLIVSKAGRTRKEPGHPNGLGGKGDHVGSRRSQEGYLHFGFLEISKRKSSSITK